MIAIGPAAPASPPACSRPVIFLDHATQLAAVERDWKHLARSSPALNPFLSWEWQHAWVRAHAGRLQPLVLAETFPDGSFAGMLTLQRVRRRGLMHLEFLSQGSGADELDCLLHPQAPPDIAARLLRVALDRHGWDLLRLEGALAGGALACALAANRRAHARAEAGELLPFIQLPPSFDQFLASRSPNFRSEVRRRWRHLRRAAPKAFLECLESPAALSAALEHVFRLHNLRRAQKAGHGVFESPALCAFHRRAATQLAAVRQARVYLLRTPGEVIAALYGFEAGQRFYYFQSGFDPAWSALSPGTVLLSAVIQNCIERGLRQFDFLRGEEAYKGRWSEQRRQSENWIGAQGAFGHAFIALRAWRRRHCHPGAGLVVAARRCHEQSGLPLPAICVSLNEARQPSDQRERPIPKVAAPLAAASSAAPADGL